MTVSFLATRAMAAMYCLALASIPAWSETLGEIPVTTAALVTNATPAPQGWEGFCKRNPADCNVGNVKSKRIVMTDDVWQMLEEVNASVNQSITPISDMDHWGVAESWDYPTDGKGDCEDFALLKRKILMNSGLPRQSLSVTVVFDRRQQGHAILMVETNRGDFVLDNQIKAVTGWNKTGYTYIKRQSAENPNSWVGMRDGSADVTVAAN